MEGKCKNCVDQGEKCVPFFDVQNTMMHYNWANRRMLIALAVSASNSPAVSLAMKQLSSLSGCEMHISHMPSPGDEAGLRKLGINLTCDPKFASRDLFIS